MACNRVLDSLLYPLSECLDAESARRVSECKIGPDTQRRVEPLAERANEGLLSEEERAKYEAAVTAADIIAILKLKAIRNLERHDNS